MVEDDFSSARRQGIDPAANGLGLAQDFKDSLRAGAGILDDIRELSDHPDAMTNGHKVEDHFREIANGKFTCDDLTTANPENQRSAESVEELRPRHAARPVIHGA